MTPKRPNIDSQIPKGFELFYNEITQHWALRPVKGFSQKFLNKDTFIPKKPQQAELFEKTEEVSDKQNKNSNLHNAKREKNDEFYTTLSDITKELKHYKEHFKGAVVYCPCDKCFNDGMSNFARYFIGKFHGLGLKKLICTQYNPNYGGHGTAYVYDFEKHGIQWEYNGEKEDGADIDESDIDTFILKGNGSFDSDECRQIMNECDIVVTNPPFSLFREFVGQIMDLGKKFLIIGNQNAISYKEVFSYIQNNEMWLGYTNPKVFQVPLDKVENEKTQFMDEDGAVYQKFGNICWYTNLTHNKRTEKLYLGKKYSPEKYPTYDNYDAIEVSKVIDIPNDYFGIMGVPVTFLDKYNPKQFKIVGRPENMDLYGLKTKMYTSQECKDAQLKILGKTGTYNLNRGSVLVKDGNLIQTYNRIFIKRIDN